MEYPKYTKTEYSSHRKMEWKVDAQTSPRQMYTYENWKRNNIGKQQYYTTTNNVTQTIDTHDK